MIGIYGRSAGFAGKPVSLLQDVRGGKEILGGGASGSGGERGLRGGQKRINRRMGRFIFVWNVWWLLGPHRGQARLYART